MKSVVKSRILSVCILLVVFLLASSCEKEELTGDIYFPVGRISVLNNNITVKTDIHDFNYELVYDSCGGYWIKFSSTQPGKNSEIIVVFTRTDDQTEDFIDSRHLENWLKASWYIDCDKEAIIDKALEITEGLYTNLEKATGIQQYIVGYLEYYTDYYKPADVKASKTLEEGIGVCMNFSRLYVALCRAAGVPARSVWGIVYGHSDDGIYDYHHQWAEVCDEVGTWHTCDFRYYNGFFNNNMKYLDLVYGPEENSSITGITGWISLLNDMDYWHNYPVACTGRLGFELVADNRPDSMVVEYIIQF